MQDGLSDLIGNLRLVLASVDDMARQAESPHDGLLVAGCHLQAAIDSIVEAHSTKTKASIAGDNAIQRKLDGSNAAIS